MRPLTPEAERVELRIDALAAGGDGVGRAPDGRVVFVPMTAPGDRVRVRLEARGRRFARGELEALLEPGASRVTPRCPVFGVCGGCAWQHVRYEEQVEAKRAILRDALVRIGRLDSLPEIGFTPSPEAYGYRGRARVLVAGGEVGFRRRRSHALCAVRGCPLLAPALDRALARLAEAPPPGEGEWELALGADGTVRVAPLGGHRAGHDAGAPDRAAQPSQEEPARVVLRAAGESIEVSVGVFAQAHVALLDALADAVVDAAGGGRVALEAHAGAGAFTLALARRFERVVAVESDPAAARDLARNAAAAGARGIEVVPARLEAWLQGGGAARLAPDAIVLDPPRAGVGRAMAARLAALPARRVVHLSCDPATLARDLAVFVEQGFRPTRVHGFDLFPQTPHVEGLVLLERERGSGGAKPRGPSARRGGA